MRSPAGVAAPVLRLFLPVASMNYQFSNRCFYNSAKINKTPVGPASSRSVFSVLDALKGMERTGWSTGRSGVAAGPGGG
jgi:hypothetical protein